MLSFECSSKKSPMDSPTETDPRTSSHMDPKLLISYAQYSDLRNDSRSSYSQPRASNKPLIKTTLHPTLPLAIHNYTEEVLFRDAWDPLTLSTRTLVTETTTGAVVSRSFSKFFNYHEKYAYKPTGREFKVVVEEKLDGSIASLFWYAGQWMVISKAQFDGQHVEMARDILSQGHPQVTDTLDKEKTYVFEIIHPDNPIGVWYGYRDLVLLSVFNKDGAEPPWDFDWSIYPFRRPKIISVEEGVNNLAALKELGKKRQNEEGFVVKFWVKEGDARPERVKVKFEWYLDLMKSKTRVSPSGIVEVYINRRTAIHEMDDEEDIKRQMREAKDAHIEFLRRIADDFGGEAWIQQIRDIWDHADEYFAEREAAFRTVKAVMRKEGWSDKVGTNDREVKSLFAKRIAEPDVEKDLRPALFAWLAGASVEKQISGFYQRLQVPKELKSIEALSKRQRKDKEKGDR